MSAPKSGLIVADIVSALAAITTGNGYNHTLAGVDGYVREARHLGSGELPRCMVAVSPSPTATQHQMFGLMTETMRISIIGVALASSIATRYDTAAKLDDDITAAVLADPRRGGNAVSTTVTETQDDQALPEIDATGARVCVVKTFEIRYDRTSGRTAA
jgi:hypothetical protein